MTSLSPPSSKSFSVLEKSFSPSTKKSPHGMSPLFFMRLRLPPPFERPKFTDFHDKNIRLKTFTALKIDTDLAIKRKFAILLPQKSTKKDFEWSPPALPSSPVWLWRFFAVLGELSWLGKQHMWRRRKEFVWECVGCLRRGGGGGRLFNIASHYPTASLPELSLWRKLRRWKRGGKVS